MRGLRVLAVFGIVSTSIAVLGGCNKQGGNTATTASISGGEDTSSDVRPTSANATVRGRKPAPKFHLPVVIIETNLGNIKVRLRDDKAPVTVDNFLENYVERGFYEQTVFHHVEKGVMIAAGGYSTELEAKPTRAWIRNESNNGLSNTKGTLSMAHHPDYPHSATSQFFINIVDNPSFDFRAPQEGELTEDAYGYCVFGEIIEGLDVAVRIANAEVHSTELFPSIPTESVIIQAIRRDDASSSSDAGSVPPEDSTSDLDLKFDQNDFGANVPHGNGQLFELNR